MDTVYDVLEGDVRDTPLGPALYVRIHRRDMWPMTYRELWDAFAAHYPGRWAVEMFPPAERLLDQAHKYHLFVLDRHPRDFDLTEPARVRK